MSTVVCLCTHQSVSSAAIALGIVRDSCAALLALLRARRDLVVHDLRRASAKQPHTYGPQNSNACKDR